MFYQFGVPFVRIYLKDGCCIALRGRVLEKFGEKSKVDTLRGTTVAYDELISLIESKLD